MALKRGDKVRVVLVKLTRECVVKQSGIGRICYKCLKDIPRNTLYASHPAEDFCLRCVEAPE